MGKCEYLQGKKETPCEEEATFRTDDGTRICQRHRGPYKLRQTTVSKQFQGTEIADVAERLGHVAGWAWVRVDAKGNPYIKIPSFMVHGIAKRLDQRREEKLALLDALIDATGYVANTECLDPTGESAELLQKLESAIKFAKGETR